MVERPVDNRGAVGSVPTIPTNYPSGLTCHVGDMAHSRNQEASTENGRWQSDKG